MNQKLQTLKGFRDFLPTQAKKRQYVINTLKRVFELYGFEPLETPALEYEEILMGKYGEEGDKLMYRFSDLGGRRVVMRYDQTVPLARVVAQYQNELPMPFKRYQIQSVWRAENTQKGRFREFLQCDADIVGVDTPLSDAEVMLVAVKSLERLGFNNYEVLINDRQIFPQLNKQGLIQDKELPTVLRSLDKIKKIGEEGIIQELQKKGFSESIAQTILQNAKTMKKNDRVIKILEILQKFELNKNKIVFSPALARGLDYYTGLIFEIEIEGYSAGSVCGGGRYDQLIGMFARSAGSGQAGREIPAVGFAFGFDRLIEAMEELKLFPANLSVTQVLVTIFSEDLIQDSINVCSRLRSNNISTELYLDPTKKLETQLKYADKKKIPWVIIIGPEEKNKGVLTVKNLKEKEQKTISLDEFIPLISNL